MTWKYFLNHANMSDGYYKDKVVVITGGSSGIGLAVAKEFAKQGAELVLIARDKEKLADAKSILEKISTSTVLILSADVSNKEEITTLINEVGNKNGMIDLLINCAGMITCGRFNEQPVEDLEKCMRVNYFGSLYTSKAAWPYLKAAKGQLSFVSSVAGYIGLIGYSSYAPGKFALAGLAECLRIEGKDDDIRVSVIYPPDTDTPLLHHEHKHSLPESKALSKNIKVKTAEKVAKQYVQALQRNKFSIYCDTESQLLRWFKNNFPEIFNYLINRIIQKARRVARK